MQRPALAVCGAEGGELFGEASRRGSCRAAASRRRTACSRRDPRPRSSTREVFPLRNRGSGGPLPHLFWLRTPRAAPPTEARDQVGDVGLVFEDQQRRDVAVRRRIPGHIEPPSRDSSSRGRPPACRRRHRQVGHVPDRPEVAGHVPAAPAGVEAGGVIADEAGGVGVCRPAASACRGRTGRGRRVCSTTGGMRGTDRRA